MTNARMGLQGPCHVSKRTAHQGNGMKPSIPRARDSSKLKRRAGSAPLQIFAMSSPSAPLAGRFAAQLIDGLTACAISAACHPVTQFFQAHDALALAGGIAYLLLRDGLPGGRSIGKRLTRSRVVHVETGESCTYAQSLVRNLSGLVLSIVDAAFIAGGRRLRLGDRLARTRVVSATKSH